MPRQRRQAPLVTRTRTRILSPRQLLTCAVLRHVLRREPHDARGAETEDEPDVRIATDARAEAAKAAAEEVAAVVTEGA
jgi:hypothetical protein